MQSGTIYAMLKGVPSSKMPPHFSPLQCLVHLYVMLKRGHLYVACIEGP